jgi:hypothetical protein
MAVIQMLGLVLMALVMVQKLMPIVLVIVVIVVMDCWEGLKPATLRRL